MDVQASKLIIEYIRIEGIINALLWEDKSLKKTLKDFNKNKVSVINIFKGLRNHFGAKLPSNSYLQEADQKFELLSKENNENDYPFGPGLKVMDESLDFGESVRIHIPEEEPTKFNEKVKKAIKIFDETNDLQPLMNVISFENQETTLDLTGITFNKFSAMFILVGLENNSSITSVNLSNILHFFESREVLAEFLSDNSSITNFTIDGNYLPELHKILERNKEISKVYDIVKLEVKTKLNLIEDPLWIKKYLLDNYDKEKLSEIDNSKPELKDQLFSEIMRYYLKSKESKNSENKIIKDLAEKLPSSKKQSSNDGYNSDSDDEIEKKENPRIYNANSQIMETARLARIAEQSEFIPDDVAAFINQENTAAPNNVTTTAKSSPQDERRARYDTNTPIGNILQKEKQVKPSDQPHSPKGKKQGEGEDKEKSK